MLKIRPFLIFGLNGCLLFASWAAYKFPHGDEYLILFLVSLVFMIAPFALTLRMIMALFSVNLVFCAYYYFLGALNAIDIAVIMVLFGSAASASYLVRALYSSFASFYSGDIIKKRNKYNGVIDQLDDVARHGAKTEKELSRISRLYEVTKQLAPALKFDDLSKGLFDFLEKNFKFQTTHLLVFSDGSFVRGISKDVDDDDYLGDLGGGLDYKKTVDYIRERGYEPFFADRNEAAEVLDLLKVKADTFMVFPLFVGEKLCAVIATEGASKTSYGRFRILISQIALEFRKVELYEQVQKLSIVDGLTEVYLRRYLLDRLEEEVDRSGRLGLTFSIAMVDVDNFKECNDRHGHLVGDAVLKKIAERLQGSVREVDMISRYGGEEFCIMLPDTAKKSALIVAERLRSAVGSRKISAFNEEIRATVSVGVATYPRDGKNVVALVEAADTALYKAKRTGRNTVCAA
ncbi:MAG: GGDEF domain-containing protein [Candidatus Omnitrophota bacterium]